MPAFCPSPVFRILTTFVLLLSLSLQSCYSVRLVSNKGVANPTLDMNDDDDDYYRDKTVIVVNKVVKANILIDDIQYPMQREGCESGKLFSVEYKNTLGGSLLYLITFGSKRKVKLKYVCMLDEN